MKKIAAFIITTFLLISCILCACDSKEKVPFDEAYYQVSETYIAYLETAMKDWQKAVNDFVYLENMDDEEVTLVLSGDPFSFYKILRFEELSDSLWVVETLMKAEYAPLGSYGVNYVGYLDGKWYVFLNVKNLPATLTEGVEIPYYENHAEGM